MIKENYFLVLIGGFKAADALFGQGLTVVIENDNSDSGQFCSRPAGRPSFPW